MTDWPEDLKQWILDHPEHILFKAAKLREWESYREKNPTTLDKWEHATFTIWSTMIYYRRIHHIEDFEACAEQTFKVFVERRLKG